MAETNLIKTPDMGTVNAIDFTERFGLSIAKLQEALGITRAHPMAQGNKIQLYKTTVTPALGEGVVPEGDDIPLTHVKRELDREFNVAFKKYRKAVSMEEVQRVGYEKAVNDSDKKVLGMIQKNIRDDFFKFLSLAPTKNTATNLQSAFGKNWGKLNAIFEDAGAVEIIQFINPEDAGEYIGDAVIANGSSVGFGMTLLKDFTGAGTVITHTSVPRGKVYATVVDNLNLMYIDVHGDASKVFEGAPVISDELGLIGLVKSTNTTNATAQSTIFQGVTLFAEVVDGVIETTISKATTSEVVDGVIETPISKATTSEALSAKKDKSKRGE